MNTQRLIDKLTSWPVTLTVCLLIVLGTLTVKLWPRTVPFDQCSEIYQKYASMENVKASFIKDYKVNDTLTLDVTLLEATSDSGWARLVEEFNLSGQFNAELPSDTNAVSFWFAPRNHYNLPMDSTLLNNDIVVASQYRKTMAVFHITSEDQINAIVFRQIVNVKPQ